MTAPGEVLNDRYELKQRLGKGSMGGVWKAYDRVLERTVAVKELITNPSGGEALEIRVERVRREALALAKVEHDAIVTIHDLIYVRSAEDPWIVMGYVHGRSLHDILAAGARLSDKQVAVMGLAVLDGLMACHRLNVHHRDVKPSNIVVGEDGSVRLVDFGIAQVVGKESLTAPSSTLGTLEYMAPELFERRPKAGPATDLWALAVTLYSAVAGQTPFWAESQGAICAAIANREPAPPGRGPLSRLIMRMLRKTPADRPDAATVARTLRGIAGAVGAGGRLAQQGLGETGEHPGGTGYPPRPQPAGHWDGAQAYVGQRRSLLRGMPPVQAAQLIAGWSADRAAAELLMVEPTAAAKIMNQSAVRFAGEVLSSMTASQPNQGRKILEIVTADRAGGLLDHMTAAAAADVLALPPTAGAAGLLAEAEAATAIGALAEMPADRAAPLVLAIGETSAVHLLRMMPDPATVAGILAHVSATTRQALLNRLPAPFRALVVKHLQTD